MKLSDALKRKQRKENRTVTIREVLQQNIGILENLRIPAREKEIWTAIQAVLYNEKVCVEAMEQQRKAEQAELKPVETEEEPEGTENGEN